MEEQDVQEKLNEEAHKKVKLGEELKKALIDFEDLPGVSKVQRKIQQELKFLNKVITTKSVKEHHITSSNFVYYDFLIKTLRLQQGVVDINAVFRLESRDNPLRVDIVANNGLKWVKVIARNSKSVEDAAKGCVSIGARSVLDQAEDYLEASELSFCMFQRPKIVFYFSNKIEDSLHEELLEMGVQTASLESPDSDLDQYATTSNELNLDVTTLLAYVSALTNGSANWVYKEPLLTEQAERERASPLKPLLEKILEGKTLVCCQLAYDAFQSILDIVGGEGERKRAEELMNRVTVFPDVENIPEEFSHIRFTANVNERSLKIFSFGMARQIFTVTSNKAFVRSAKMQAHFHERRSERFIRNHRYEEAIKALETSLIYMQDAQKRVALPKSIEVLNTLTLDFQRKLRQIEMRKTQHGLNKLKDFAPLKETSPMLPLRPENGASGAGGSAQSVAKAIDKTVQDFDAKFTSSLIIKVPNNLANSEPQMETLRKSDPLKDVDERDPYDNHRLTGSDDLDLPSLAPLELPSFDYSLFTSSSAPSLASYAGMAESFQK
ncbi:hypothetical protein M5D96_007637 [Drosophila gunungcola]|uniref:Uncharacterized protein n=1 Tax=Drosophila gunungcola TaxID=103775 RepID=A0A9P9YL26_9MUSC|nr:hypothetical protein M5D96_007637 [Drosophila gunungcola]